MQIKENLSRTLIITIRNQNTCMYVTKKSVEDPGNRHQNNIYEHFEEFLKLGKFYQQDQSVATFLF